MCGQTLLFIVIANCAIDPTLSHRSTQSAWNSCWHGRARTSSLGSKSHRHTTHDVWCKTEPAAAAESSSDWSSRSSSTAALYR